ncbi:hypothetical protein PTI98_000636 [Pleurotus ostreatus]|nr:hypothetical protein PTI98_000636 [Pleurotus ostreatus]
MRNSTPTWSRFIRAPTWFSPPSSSVFPKRYKEHRKSLVQPQNLKLRYAHDGSLGLANHESCQIQVNQPEYPPATGYYVRPHPNSLLENAKAEC